MARYSSRRGPQTDLEIGVGPDPLDRLIVSRFFDAGELLIIAMVEMQNSTGALITASVAIFVDGVEQNITARKITLDNGARGILHAQGLIKINAGEHTIDLRARGSANAGSQIQGDTGTLIVVQLPLWDADSDLLI